MLEAIDADIEQEDVEEITGEQLAYVYEPKPVDEDNFVFISMAHNG